MNFEWSRVYCKITFTVLFFC
jgi:hypothetical protein